MSLKGNVALVTGGSRGIGRAVCLELARRGAAVAVNYAGNSAAAEETVELCRAMGVEAEAFQADVSDPAACDALAAAVWIPMNDAFHIREGRVRVDWDPLAERLTCAGQLALSLRIGQILWIGLRFGVKALAGLLRYRRLKRKAV